MAPTHVWTLAVPVGIHCVDLEQLPRKSPTCLIIHMDVSSITCPIGLACPCGQLIPDSPPTISLPSFRSCDQ